MHYNFPSLRIEPLLLLPVRHLHNCLYQEKSKHSPYQTVHRRRESNLPYPNQVEAYPLRTSGEIDRCGRLKGAFSPTCNPLRRNFLTWYHAFQGTHELTEVKIQPHWLSLMPRRILIRNGIPMHIRIPIPPLWVPHSAAHHIRISTRKPSRRRREVSVLGITAKPSA